MPVISVGAAVLEGAAMTGADNSRAMPTSNAFAKAQLGAQRSWQCKVRRSTDANDVLVGDIVQVESRAVLGFLNVFSGECHVDSAREAVFCVSPPWRYRAILYMRFP